MGESMISSQVVTNRSANDDWSTISDDIAMVLTNTASKTTNLETLSFTVTNRNNPSMFQAYFSSTVTDRNNPSISQAHIQNGLFWRPPSSTESQGNSQRMRTHLGQYPYESRTGMILRPNCTISKFSICKSLSINNLTVMHLYNYFVINLEAMHPLEKQVIKIKWFTTRKKRRQWIQHLFIIDFNFSVPYHLNVGKLSTLSKIANLTDPYFKEIRLFVILVLFLSGLVLLVKSSTYY